MFQLLKELIRLLSYYSVFFKAANERSRMYDTDKYTSVLILKDTMKIIRQGAVAREIKYHEYLEQVIQAGLKITPATKKSTNT